MFAFGEVAQDFGLHHATAHVVHLIADIGVVVQFEADLGGITNRVGIHRDLAVFHNDGSLWHAATAVLTVGLATEQASAEGGSIDNTLVVGARINGGHCCHTVEDNGNGLVFLVHKLLLQIHDRDIAHVVRDECPFR